MGNLPKEDGRQESTCKDKEGGWFCGKSLLRVAMCLVETHTPHPTPPESIFYPLSHLPLTHPPLIKIVQKQKSPSYKNHADCGQSTTQDHPG